VDHLGVLRHVHDRFARGAFNWVVFQPRGGRPLRRVLLRAAHSGRVLVFAVVALARRVHVVLFERLELQVGADLVLDVVGALLRLT